MNLFRMLSRSIRDAFKSVFRNFSLSLASISCITITLIIVAISIIASFNIDHITGVIENDLTVVVFLDQGVTEEGIEYVENRLNAITNIESIEFRSRMEIQEQFMNDSEEFRVILDGLDQYTTPIKDTFLIQVKKLEEIRNTVSSMEEISYVSVVQYGEDLIDTVIDVSSRVTTIAFATVGALILVTIFLIINTIKLTIFSRQREIGIMRLVGASNFTIKTPFIIEGMILGLIGAVIPVIITTYGYIAFYNSTNGYLFSPLLRLIEPEPFIYQASIMVVIIGIIVGMIGSSSAVRRYLKV